MPGSKQTAFVPMSVGLATNVADVMLPVGAGVLEVENGFFLRSGECVRRYGSVELNNTTVGGGAALPQSWAMATHKGGLLSLQLPGARPLASWAPTRSEWATDGGSIPAVATEMRGPIKPTRTQVSGDGRNPAMAYVGGYYFVGSQTLSSTGTVINHQAVLDAATGEQVFKRSFDTTIVATVLGHMVVTVGSSYAVFVYHTTGNDIAFSTWTLANLPAGPSTTTFATTSTQAPRLLDAIGDAGSTLVRVVYSGGGNAAGVDFSPATLATTAWTFTDAAAAAIPIDGTLGWMLDTGFGGSGKLAVMTSSNAQGTRVQWDVPAAGAARQATATHTLDAAAGLDVRRIVGYTRSSSAGGEYTVCWTRGTVTLPATTDFTNIYHRAGGVVSGSSTIYRSASLVSKPWTYGGDYYALVGFLGSVTQATYYVVRIPLPTPGLAFPAPLAIIAPNAAEWVSSGSFCTVANPSTGKFVTAANVGIRLQGGGISTAVIASDMLTIEHSQVGVNDGLGQPIEAADSTFVPGGVLGQFDGLSYATAGFAYGPEPLTLTANATPGGLTPTAIYYWATVFAYPDGQGRLWRSKPSITTSRTIGAETSQNVRSSTERLVGRAGGFIEFYRGVAGIASELRKVGQMANDPTVDTLTFVDSMSDATLLTQPPIYTTGGIKPNDTLPGALSVIATKDRVFVVPTDNPRQIWPSSRVTDGDGLFFSEDNIIAVDDSFGDLTGGLAALDDKVVSLKAAAVYAFNGDGPDPLGRGGFSEPQIVALGVGCTNPKSVVSTREGVIFQSTSTPKPGMQMLDRSLAIANGPDGAPFGAAVQRYTETIIASVLVPKQSQARFFAPSGRVLVADLITGQWTTYVYASPLQAATVWGGQVIYATGFAQYGREDDTGAVRTDLGVAYARRIASAWVQSGGVKGFEHVIAIQGVGQTAGDHTLTATLYQNLDDTDVAGTRPYTMTVAGRALWNWELVPRYRRSEAFKVVLVETCTTAGAKINGVAFEVSARRGLSRRREADRL